jgi:hypothetical protein
VILPEEYIVQKFYSYNGGVKYLKHQRVYQGSCFICKEGASWLKKKRCYYIVKDDAICCHNCGWYSKPFKWIQEVTGLTYDEIKNEIKSYEIIPTNLTKDREHKKPVVVEKLPHDSINLLDKNQLLFYKDNHPIRQILRLMQSRRLITAVNRPKALYTSLTDRVHAHRLIIPFYSDHGEVIFYQSRGVMDIHLKTYPKYLGKVGGEKSLFNIDKVDPSSEFIFIFEGPINAFFCKNGIAVAGIQERSYNTFTSVQSDQIQKFPLHRKIWILDSQWKDNASCLKTQKLIEIGEEVFIWPEKEGKLYKDFNDIAIDRKIDQIDVPFILFNTYSGLQASLQLANIRNAPK